MPNNNDSFKKSSFFPTLFFQVNVDNAAELNKHLLQSIYNDRKDDQKGISRSNVKSLGGWHSKVGIHKQPEYTQLVKHINSATSRMSKELGYAKDQVIKIGTMWSIINPPGSMNISHIHPGCLWSGVYYVQAPKNSGNIEFVDPRTMVLMQQAKFKANTKRPKDCWNKVNFTPIEGKMIIFPSWLYHSVRPNMSEESDENSNRVIVSFNLSQHKV